VPAWKYSLPIERNGLITMGRIELTPMEAAIIMGCMNDTKNALDRDRGRVTPAQHAELAVHIYAIEQKLEKVINQ
jgi:hypothetical protein